MQGNVEHQYNKTYFDRMDALSWKRKRRAIGKYEEQFLQLLKASKNDKILDVGCGTGWHIFHYGPQCRFVVGIDISREGLKRASRRLKSLRKHSNVQFIRGSVEKLPFSKNSFNKVLCVSLIEHVEHPRISLSEMHRVLLKNGLIVIGTPNRFDPFYQTLQFVADKTHKKMPIIGYPDKTHKTLFTLPTLKTLLIACGFSITKIKVQYSLLVIKTFGGDFVVGAMKR